MSHLPLPESIRRSREDLAAKFLNGADRAPSYNLALANKIYRKHAETIVSDREITRRTLRLFFWGCVVFMLVSGVIMTYGEDLMSPRASHLMHRLSAGLFLFAVICNFVYRLGWSGGGKEIDRSGVLPWY